MDAVPYWIQDRLFQVEEKCQAMLEIQPFFLINKGAIKYMDINHRDVLTNDSEKN